MTHSPSSHCSSSAPAHIAVPVICVVDPQRADYQAWCELADRQEIDLRFFASAGEALRHARREHVDLWVVNSDLAGVSGCELCGMLKTQSAQVGVYLLTDSYDAAVERSAWAARATMFDVKPLHNDRLLLWLAHWRNKQANVRRSAAPQPVATR